ncbi:MULTISPECIES: glutathione S-transferase family protein [unclassified Sphingomonas]|uniref:glutathione S-transferase family protein n=1 Tax=unclassified Sphingomonas TaxID=196159 RepID=UPI000BD29628|nr:MAG: glutathione S-transferase [Sphingomonas sp. 32-62-10]
MLFYDAANPAPNPRRVRIFLAEKGLKVPTEQLSIVAGDHKKPEFLAVNPLGQIPALKLDDGEVITESLSICRFFEALNPDPPMFGKGPKGVAEVDMWVRRVELRLMVPVGMVWMHTHPFTARVVVPQYKDFGESNRPRAIAAMRYFDESLAGRTWIAGKDYSIADITLLTTIDFAIFIGIGLSDDMPNLKAWHERASARPSAQA